MMAALKIDITMMTKTERRRQDSEEWATYDHLYIFVCKDIADNFSNDS